MAPKVEQHETEVREGYGVSSDTGGWVSIRRRVSKTTRGRRVVFDDPNDHKHQHQNSAIEPDRHRILLLWFVAICDGVTGPDGGSWIGPPGTPKNRRF